MPFDVAGFKADVAEASAALEEVTALNDLRLMRAALATLQNQHNWCKNYGRTDTAHCVVGWLNVYAGECLVSGETGRRIAAQWLYPELEPTPKEPPWIARLLERWGWTRRLPKIPPPWQLVQWQDELPDERRARSVMLFNDCEGWAATRDLLGRSIAKLEETVDAV